MYFLTLLFMSFKLNLKENVSYYFSKCSSLIYDKHFFWSLYFQMFKWFLFKSSGKTMVKLCFGKENETQGAPETRQILYRKLRRLGRCEFFCYLSLALTLQLRLASN
jgi:hypothetical protein